MEYMHWFLKQKIRFFPDCSLVLLRDHTSFLFFDNRLLLKVISILVVCLFMWRGNTRPFPQKIVFYGQFTIGWKSIQVLTWNSTCHIRRSLFLFFYLKEFPTGNSVNELQDEKSQDFPSFCPRNRPLRLLGYEIHTHNENHKFKIIFRNP